MLWTISRLSWRAWTSFTARMEWTLLSVGLRSWFLLPLFGNPENKQRPFGSARRCVILSSHLSTLVRIFVCFLRMWWFSKGHYMLVFEKHFNSYVFTSRYREFPGQEGKVVPVKSLAFEYLRHCLHPCSPSLLGHPYQTVSLYDGVLGPLKTHTSSMNLSSKGDLSCVGCLTLTAECLSRQVADRL